MQKDKVRVIPLQVGFMKDMKFLKAWSMIDSTLRARKNYGHSCPFKEDYMKFNLTKYVP